MDSNGSILAELFLRFMHLTDEVYESFAGLRDALLRPVREMELSDRSRLSVLYTANSSRTVIIVIIIKCQILKRRNMEFNSVARILAQRGLKIFVWGQTRSEEPKLEATKAESWSGVLGEGELAPSPLDIRSGEHCKLTRGVRGHSPGCQALSCILYTSDGFSWHFNSFWSCNTAVHILTV